MSRAVPVGCRVRTSAFGEPFFSRVDMQLASRQRVRSWRLPRGLACGPARRSTPRLARAGFNPNRCPACAWTADWHYFEGAVANRAYHEQSSVIVTEVVRFAEVESIAPSSSG